MFKTFFKTILTQIRNAAKIRQLREGLNRVWLERYRRKHNSDPENLEPEKSETLPKSD